MKKLAILIASLFLVSILFCACTPNLDFSDTIEGKMDELYNTIRDLAEPFLKQDSSYSDSDTTIPDDGTTIPSQEGGEVNEG